MSYVEGKNGSPDASSFWFGDTDKETFQAQAIKIIQE